MLAIKIVYLVCKAVIAVFQM